MIRPLILFLLMVANAACVSYVDDFAYLPVLRAQEGGGKCCPDHTQEFRVESDF